MVEGRERNEIEGPGEVRLRVYGSNAQDPEEGKIFVLTNTGWFERIEGFSGNVAFSPVAGSEVGVRELMASYSRSANLVELTGEFSKMVSDEFLEQSPSYGDYTVSPVNDPEDEDDDQQYHQHDQD